MMKHIPPLTDQFLFLPDSFRRFLKPEVVEPLFGNENGQGGEKRKHPLELVLSDDRNRIKGRQILVWIVSVGLCLPEEAFPVWLLEQNLPRCQRGDMLAPDDNWRGSVHQAVAARHDVQFPEVFQALREMDVALLAKVGRGRAGAMELGADIPPSRGDQQFLVGVGYEAGCKSRGLGKLFKQVAESVDLDKVLNRIILVQLFATRVFSKG